MTDIQALIRKVRESNPRELDEDTRTQLQRPETIATFLEMLRVDDWEVRSDASWGLWFAGKPAIPGLIEALNDASWNVRDDAAETLGLIGDLSAVPVLIEAMIDREKGILSSVVEALTMIVMEHGDLPELHSLLKHHDPYVRLGAADALGDNAGSEGIQGFIDLVRYGITGDASEFEKAAECLSAIGKPAIPALIELLKGDDVVLRRLAAQVLATIGDPSALRAMIAATNDEDDDVRQDVIMGLGGFGQEALPALLKLIVDDDGQNGWCAYTALREIGVPAVEGLFAILGQEDDQKRKWVADTLGFIQMDSKSQPILDRLNAALNDDNPYVRQGAADALALLSQFGKPTR